MTFLQPFILWALPLILLPVIIHLINRMRHRRQPWAAMQFLLSATRSSVSHAKLRQFLVLLFRVLAVLALILFLSRPIAGGWIGWALSPAPDVIIMLLDRSASMETGIAGTDITRREQAIQLFTQAAAEFEHASHLVLIDSATREPQRISSASSLAEISLAAPSDTAADVPAMLATALKWIVDNRAGAADLWLASDLQQSNWHPDDPRLASVLQQFETLPQKVRFRLLAFNQPPAGNTSVAIQEMIRRPAGERSELLFTLDLERTQESAATFPVAITLDGVRTQAEVSMEGNSTRWRHRIDLGEKQSGGWGSFEIPADSNASDNTAYFVYGPDQPVRALVVSDDPRSGRILQVAAGAFATDGTQTVRRIASREADSADFDEMALILWHAPLPSGPAQVRLREFIESGGVAAFFPAGSPAQPLFQGFGWSTTAIAPENEPFRIASWDENQGPLARTEEGFSLPMRDLEVFRRVEIIGNGITAAAFEDGAPFITRQTLGTGEFYFWASLPDDEWSTLAEGHVLVPALQRLLQNGSRRLQQASSVYAGEMGLADLARHWVSVDSEVPKDVRFQTGVYRAGERLLSVNRPPPEDDSEMLGLDEARALFGSLPIQLLQDRDAQTAQLQAEFWRIFLFAMLAFLIIESLLVLPARSAAQTGAGADAPKSPQPAMEAQA